MMSGAPTATSPETSPSMSALTGSSARAGVRLAWSRLRPAPDREHGFPCPRSSHGLSALRFPGGSEGGASSASPPRLYLHGGEECPERLNMIYRMGYHMVNQHVYSF